MKNTAATNISAEPALRLPGSICSPTLPVLVTVVLLLIIVLPCIGHPAEAQPSAGSAAVEAVKVIAGSQAGTEETKNSIKEKSPKHPYEERKAPDSFSGWVDYMVYFPLYKTGGEWIRLHSLLTALFILVTGIWFAIFSGRLLKKGLLRIKVIPGHIVIAFSQIVVYLLIFFVILGTVLFADMPFSIVSVLGAILLVGASLGAKSTIYDYLSGLILALEQPIRIHDCIEVGDQAGFVEEIRGRYTRVRRFDGIDILVPNSKFLEEDVVNWTLTDSELRGDFKIEVHYSSDVNETMDLLIGCLKDSEGVLAEPSPSVLFWEFGANGLIFRIFFWAQVENPLEMWSITSKLRRRSFNRLKNAGVAVAYPQRDVHLDSAEPLKVVVTRTHSAIEDGKSGETAPEKEPDHPEHTRKRGDSERVAEPESSKNEEKQEKKD